MMKYFQLLFCYLLCCYSANAEEELWRIYPNPKVVDAANFGNSLYMVGETLFEPTNVGRKLLLMYSIVI